MPILGLDYHNKVKASGKTRKNYYPSGSILAKGINVTGFGDTSHPGIENVLDLRLDVASPAKVNQPVFEIAAAIRLSDEDILELSSLENTLTGKGIAIQRNNLGLLRFRIRAIARDCKPEVIEEDVIIQMGKPTEPIYFQFKAHESNGISIIVNAYQVERKETLVASVRTYVEIALSEHNQIAPALSRKELDQKLLTKNQLYEWLNSVFSFSELEDLCFRLGINWDDVTGGSDKKKKIRELIYWFDRGNDLDTLSAAILRLRPKLLN